MRLRIRGPNGVSTITLEDTAMVCELQATIAEKTGLPSFDLKVGYPPQPLDLAQFDPATLLVDTDLKLNGEQLIAAAKDAPSSQSQQSQASTTPSTSATSSQSVPAPAKSKPLALSRKQNPQQDPPEIPLPTHDATLILRVMPDDNSCLFRALGTAVLTSSLDTMSELRSLVAQGIQSAPSVYTPAILQQPPDEYCRWIQDPDSWGGAIEIGILAQSFGVEVASISVQDLRVDRFNDGPHADKRVILVYSGIHYDTIALSPGGADLPADFDQYVFPADDDAVLQGALELCRELKNRKYFTDTAKFRIRCNVRGCGWTGNGEKAASEHAANTGHMDFGEVD